MTLLARLRPGMPPAPAVEFRRRAPGVAGPAPTLAAVPRPADPRGRPTPPRPTGPTGPTGPTVERRRARADEAPNRGPGAPPLVRATAVAVGLLLALDVLAFLLSVLQRTDGPSGFDPLLDGWAQGSAYVLTAVLAALRPATSPVHRRLWTLVAVALACRAAAFVVFLAVVRPRGLPSPSLADVGWLAMAFVLAAALVELIRTRFSRLSRTLVLDGVVGALGVGAIGVALVDPAVLPVPAGGPRAAVLVNLAYPVLDVALLILVAGLLAASRWRLSPAASLLAAGVAGFAVVDSVFLVQQAQGTFRPGTFLSVLSLGATAAMACAAWAPERVGTTERRVWLPGAVIPAVSSLTCLLLLVVASRRDLPLASVALAAGGALTAILRTSLSFRDMRALAQARRDARTDDLTGVTNRRGFTETVHEVLRDRPASEPLALLLVDLDQFKAVNDSWGHDVGDGVLRSVAPRLRAALGADDLLARIGGDEFAVVLEGVDHREASRVAERLQAVVRQPLSVASGALAVSVSVGIAMYPDDGEDASDLLQHADLALYSAKSTRTGHARFRPDVHRARAERVERVQRLRRAITDGEMVLAYQPKVALDTGRVVGAEALVRWQHPERGLLAPGAFLRQVEHGGLMGLLTLEVLDRSLRDAAVWRAREPSFTVAANLSVSDLLDVRLPEQVAGLLARHGLPGEALVLELTEDLLLTDPVRAADVMSGLVGLGSAVVIDDYGTGYSSLAYLRDLRHISGLKLDRSFVTDLCDQPRQAAIVESTVGLAAALGLELVAEGVETAEVRDRLADLGCTLAQGYYFARPVPAAELPLGVVPRAVARRSG